MQAAMRSVEDETDAAAAAALEQENAAELAEFTVEPAARVCLSLAKTATLHPRFLLHQAVAEQAFLAAFLVALGFFSSGHCC